MYKKTILSVAIASVLTLTGCLDNNKTEDDNINGGPENLDASSLGTYPIFDPGASTLPIPNDLIFDSVASDGSFSLADSAPPVTTALNRLSGASTVAPIDIKISGLIDETTVGPNSSVFLIALDYASGSPLQGLSLQEPPEVVGPASFVTEVKTFDGTSTIRIHPTTPLDPLTRYLVVITDEIEDIDGDSLTRHPGPTGYKNLTQTDDEQALADPQLASVRGLINGLWEPLAVGFFDAAINPARDAGGLSDLTDANIALSYSFMTSGDEKVLNYIADPAQWFVDQLDTFLGVSAATQIVSTQTDVDSDGDVDYTDISLAKAGAVDAFPSTAIQTALDGIGMSLAVVQSVPGCGAVTAGSAYISCMSAILGSASGPFGALLPTPADGNMDFTTNTAPASDLFSILASSPTTSPINTGYNAAGFPGFAAPGTYQVTQGTVTLPYYSGLPTNPTFGPLALKFTHWEANDTLAAAINTAFAPLGLSIPQADPAVSTVVNYIFPFPKKQGDVVVPVVAIYPTAPAANMKTLIWGHGLKGNRTDVLPFGAGVVGAAKANGADVAIIAFDEPLHGVVGDATAFHTSLERHFEYGNAGAGPTNPPLDIDITNTFPAEVGGPQGSGSMFVNLESFTTSRDNLRQNALDLLTVRKSLAAADFDNDTTPDLDATDVYYAGHSLGTISAMPFVAVANDSSTPTDDITAAMFFTPGGGISRFFENSPTFAPLLTTGLGASGLTGDTSSYQSYVNVLQAALDSVDGINFVNDYITQSTPALFVDVVDDTVIPISMNTVDRTLQLAVGEFGNLFEVTASLSHLSGASPLVTASGATTLTTAGGPAPLGRSHVRYGAGSADHCTPSVPGLAMFNENLSQTVGIILSGKLAGGPYITVTDASGFHSGALPTPIVDSFCPLSFPPAG